MDATIRRREIVPTPWVVDPGASDPEQAAGACPESALLRDLAQELQAVSTSMLGSLLDLQAGRYGRLGTGARRQIDLARRHAERLCGMAELLHDTAGRDPDAERRQALRPRAGEGRPRLPLAHGAPPPAGDRQWLEKVADAVQAGLEDETFSVETLARRLSVHRTQLFRRLRQLTGLSPVQLIRRQRLERAAALLDAGDTSVSEAACASGFRSFAHFSRCFHQRYGLPPSSYRRAGTRRSPETANRDASA